MKLNSFIAYLVALCIVCTITLFSSCSKNTDSSANQCAMVRNVKIKTAKTTYYQGETINLSTTTTPDGYYSWYFGKYSGIISSTTGYSVYGCSKGDAGWYYLSVDNVDCPVRYDSIYINVINKPDSAPCSQTNNTVSFSSIPDISFTPTVSIDPNWGVKLMYGNQGGGIYEPGGAAAFYNLSHPVYAIGAPGGWDINTPVWAFTGIP